MAVDVPVGPRRIFDQAVEAGFEAKVEHGEKDGAEAWSVAGTKDDRGFAGLWTKAPGAGVKSIGLYTWSSSVGAQAVKLADLRNWLVRP